MKLFEPKNIDHLRAEVAGEKSGLRRVLGTKELMFLGIGAVIGAGIFSTLGMAAAGEAGGRVGAGPAVVISFLLLGTVCGLAGLCYAELTAMVPIAGSAYTYAYATLGRLAAWVVGWSLILEYAVGNVAVAISWSNYLQSLLSAVHLGLPAWLGAGWFDLQQQLDAARAAADTAEVARIEAIVTGAPHVFGMPLVFNLPALVITALITLLLLRGVRESAHVNNWMVLVKLAIVALFVIVGAFYVDTSHWQPFCPNGWTGIHQGAAIAFFAFIGFDAVSTAAEETRDPQRSMPRAILGSLAICTLIYMVVAAVATGMVPYQQLSGTKPIAQAFEKQGLGFMQFVLSLGAVISMTAVLLVFQLGQPRILFSMARDGLMPKRFTELHSEYRTPYLPTLLTGVCVALGAAVMDDDLTFDLTNFGTLLAFAMVSLGVLVLRVRRPDLSRPFRVPFVWLVAPLSIVACGYTIYGLPTASLRNCGVWVAIGLALFFAMATRSRREP